MSAALKRIHQLNPERISVDLLTDALTQAESAGRIAEEDLLFAEALLQKFKYLLLSSMDLTRVSTKEFHSILSGSSLLVPTEGRRWKLKCAQVLLWLKEHSTRYSEA